MGEQQSHLEASDELMELVRAAIESGIEILKRDPDLIPMAILSDGEGSEMIAFDGLTEKQVLDALKKRLQDEEATSTAYVLRYIGEFARGTGERCKGIVVEGSTLEMPQGMEWVYLLGDYESDEVQLIGACENYFSCIDDFGSETTESDAHETPPVVEKPDDRQPSRKWWQFWRAKPQ